MRREQEYDDGAYHKAYMATLRDKERFEWMLHGIENEKSLEKKVQLAKIAASFAVINNPGYFTSALLENTFIEYAKEHDLKNYNDTYQKESFLHVMTQAYIVGGHTRVVERWIEQSPNTQNHSVVILNQRDVPIPQRLSDAIRNKNGTLTLFDEKLELLDRSLKLRQVAQHYQYIVLHIHMDDPTALIAFGTEKFTRPIIFYNHADHMFWLGVSIADVVADIRTITSISESRRLIYNPYMLGIPIENKTASTTTKEAARAKLEIPKDTKLIVTGGSPHKYRTLMGKSLIPILEDLVNATDNRVCVAIGPSNTGNWKKANMITNGKIKAIGAIPYDKGFLDYLVAADVIIDSWPMGGGTFLIDAISLKRPVIALPNPMGQSDFITKSECYCKDITDFKYKINRILSDEEYARHLVTEITRNLEKDHSIPNWTKKLHELINQTPNKHQIRDLSTKENPAIIDEWVIVVNRIYTSLKKYEYICQYLLVKCGIPNTLLEEIENQCIKIAKKIYYSIR